MKENNKTSTPSQNITQSTPSVPQYFSWVNNTNEGSTEKQTIINLEFFEWLKDKYGMEIKIYAWDAGNFDGAHGGYGDADGPKFKAQYPNGYDPVVKKASELGIRMGLWGSPDGYGDTTETEEKRYNFMVDLCKKYRFALFKVDGVCGNLRKEKAARYAEQLRECQKYCPDLIVLNHWLDLYEAEKYVTTSLWQGAETYVDVHMGNHETCMHHRGFIFKRGLPDNLDRLLEDHGVCISSSVAYFEDDLIYQAFGRCMILAPEIYGNPWLMRDDEYPKLARIYNLHKTCAHLLVDGFYLSDTYGDTPVSRGNETHRFIATGNHAWTTRRIAIKLDGEIGFNKTEEKILLIQRHPSERLIGAYNYGDVVEVDLLPFRAALFEIATQGDAYPVLEGCEYEMIRESVDGAPSEVKMLYCKGGTVTLFNKGESFPFDSFEACDIRPRDPIYLGKLANHNTIVTSAEKLYEVAQFAIDNDSLERRELRRAGETAIAQVRAARDAFFNQETYILRGCDGEAVFDGNPKTFFDGLSKTLRAMTPQNPRINGGCLRVDFGDTFDADEIEISCFAIHEPIEEIGKQHYTEFGSFSSDLESWIDTSAALISIDEENVEMPVVKFSINNIIKVTGDRMKACYKLNGAPIRYFRLPEPMDHIYSVRLLKQGKELALTNPKINNLQAPYETKKPIATYEAELTLPDILNDNDYIALAVNGIHGNEGVYCVAEIDGKSYGFPDRAPSYRSNVWEFVVLQSDCNYTYYLPLESSMAGKKIKLTALLCDKEHRDVDCDVWLCCAH